MIRYDPFWRTIKEKDVSTYVLIHQHKVSSSRLNRMRKNLPLSTVTLNDLCRILNCKLEDIVEYVPFADDQIL